LMQFPFVMPERQNHDEEYLEPHGHCGNNVSQTTSNETCSLSISQDDDFHRKVHLRQKLPDATVLQSDTAVDSTESTHLSHRGMLVI
jgi:hypothetical protein